MLGIEQSRDTLHSFGGEPLFPGRMEDRRLSLEIRPVLDQETGSRALEQRSRWLKFADLALRKQGVAPNDRDLTELASLGRAEQESIKERIDASIKNYRQIKGRSKPRTFRKAA
jgi:hypothetical protein